MHDHPLDTHTNTVNAATGEAWASWKRYRDSIPAEDLAANKTAVEFTTLFERFFSEGIDPALALLQAGRYADANLIVLRNILTRYHRERGQDHQRHEHPNRQRLGGTECGGRGDQQEHHQHQRCRPTDRDGRW